MYLDYGYTRPNVISRGPYQQDAGTEGNMGNLPAASGPVPTPAEELPEGGQEAANPLTSPNSPGPTIQPPADRGAGPMADLPPAALAARLRFQAGQQLPSEYAPMEGAANFPASQWTR
jgi:hypothetical protein